MRFVDKPTVFMLASTSVDYSSCKDYLDFLGAKDWDTNTVNDAEYLIEVAGRRCYKAFGTELNPNIKRVREGNKEYIGNILKSGHGSVLEHAYVTFAFEDVSRIFTHEHVRHRLCNYSQESMRFVRPTELTTLFPDVYTDHLSKEQAGKVKDLFEKTFTYVEDIQKELIDICGMDDPDVPFKIKKLFQSANRRAIPDGVLTGIIVTTNHRNLRNVIELRTSLHAEEEIRYVYGVVAELMQKQFPSIYQDIHDDVSLESANAYGKKVYAYTFHNSKI